jgi:plastocyanin
VLPRLTVLALLLGVALAGCTSPQPLPPGGTTNVTQVGGTGTNNTGTNTTTTNSTGNGTGNSTGSATVVSIIDNQFQPRDVRVVAGGAVRFENDGMALHSVTIQKSDGTPLVDTDVDPGEQTTVDFDEPGTYKLRCKYHSSADFSGGQVGTITAA